MAHDEKLISELEEKADIVRRNIFTIFDASQMGHAGGTMSLVEIVTALYFHHLKIDPKNCDWPERDRLVLSKAHCCEAIYAILVELGVLPRETLTTYYRYGSPLQGHADRWCTQGIDYSGGSLGQGLSFAAGLALAEKFKVLRQPPSQSSLMPRYITRYNPLYRSYCILGDGECHEGQVWEAAMFATKYKLDNLINIVDYNKFSLDGPTNEVMQIEPFVDKWKSFGWWVAEIDGHNLREIVDVLDLASNLYGDGKPKCIIAHTVKGHGISSWEAAHTHIGRGEDISRGVREGRAKYGEV
ncbi:MAG: transketolase [Dehalococcoidales bacterium]|nr:transketolase [Dehalococcoidales bacterium]